MRSMEAKKPMPGMKNGMPTLLKAYDRLLEAAQARGFTPSYFVEATDADEEPIWSFRLDADGDGGFTFVDLMPTTSGQRAVRAPIEITLQDKKGRRGRARVTIGSGSESDGDVAC